jgi:hypothetical protein
MYTNRILDVYKLFVICVQTCVIVLCERRYVGVFSAVYAGSRAAAPRADELMEHTTADDIEATLLKVQLQRYY